MKTQTNLFTKNFNVLLYLKVKKEFNKILFYPEKILLINQLNFYNLNQKV